MRHEGLPAELPKVSLYGLILSPIRTRDDLFGPNHNHQESFGGRALSIPTADSSR
jgi:hypothetical protein